jgi:outer membrane biosynthesis protein TonB
MSIRRTWGAPLLFLLATVVALLVPGCASAPKPHPAENSPAATPTPTPAPAPTAEATRPPAPEPSDEPEETITPEANQRVREAPGRLDPSEEITPQELATIPDPVPGAPPRDRPQDGSESRSGGSGTSGGSSGAGTAQERPWSVQIFASEDRGEAQRVARTAADRLQMAARVDHEAPLYKVRVGRFADEQEAQTLRTQAIRAGFAGAFRVRAGVP